MCSGIKVIAEPKACVQMYTCLMHMHVRAGSSEVRIDGVVFLREVQQPRRIDTL